MSWFPRGLWRYAVLIVLLFVLAGLAARETISSITELVQEVRTGVPGAVTDDILLRIITVPILALTMGFLFLAGALGVWAIRSTTVVESRRRVGKVVDAMDYLSDGLLAVDRKGRITGSNPAARQLAARSIESKVQVVDVFPCLTVEQERTLLDAVEPQEVECVSRGEGHQGLRALRFRSQPSEDMNLILVSDVTGMRAEEMRNRQIARLQLIGRISRGVAHDFNNILCAVSGYAALLGRPGVQPDANSVREIVKEAERGAALARQLMDLSRTGAQGTPCRNLAEHVVNAVALLRVGLSSEWQVVADVQKPLSPVPLTDVQVEQCVVNLGLLAADELPKPGFVHVRVKEPGSEALLDVGDEYAAVVMISAYGPEPETPGGLLHTEAQTTTSEAGVISSVVRSMVEEVGGRVDLLVAPSGRHSYRVCLPLLATTETRMSALSGVSEELRVELLRWQVLVASSSSGYRGEVMTHLKELGMTVHAAEDIVAALQHVEAGRDMTGLVLERELLGNEADALVRAIIKLRPHAGIVVLTRPTDVIPQGLKSEVVFEPVSAAPDAVFQALLRARELALNRRRA